MNELNYASLEASKRLYEAGIVLETDYYWWLMVDFDGHYVWELKSNGLYGPDCIPAPSMAEVWRELPEEIGTDRLELMMWKEGDFTICCYGDDRKEVWRGRQESKNPADALIELLIWLKGEAMIDTPIYTAQIVSSNACRNGHTVLWAGSTTEEVPEGVLCSCGRTVTHYTICPQCGSRKLEFVPVERISHD